MARGEIHPFEREFRKDQTRRTLEGRDKALKAAKKAPVTPEIQAALKTLHETGSAEVMINGVPVKMAYEKVTCRAAAEAQKGGAK